MIASTSRPGPNSNSMFSSRMGGLPFACAVASKTLHERLLSWPAIECPSGARLSRTACSRTRLCVWASRGLFALVRVLTNHRIRMRRSELLLCACVCAAIVSAFPLTSATPKPPPVPVVVSTQPLSHPLRRTSADLVCRRSDLARTR